MKTETIAVIAIIVAFVGGLFVGHEAGTQYVIKDCGAFQVTRIFNTIIDCQIRAGGEGGGK